MSRSEQFAKRLVARLRRSTLDVYCTQGGVRFFKVSGRLDTGPRLAAVRIVVPWLFKDVKHNPPDVYCDEEWMRTGAEWHNGPPMCWVLPEEWRDVMAWQGKPVRAIIEEGSEWICKGASSLISRHYSAYLDGLDRWPEEWSYWSHFGEGVREYKREKRRR